MADTEEPNMSYLTDAQIEEGLRLCAAATPGPWFSTDAPAVGLKFYVAACSDHTQPIVAECREIDAEADRFNSLFIAAARTLLPAALTELQRLRAQLLSKNQREMTLDEWVDRLPENHSARKEYREIVHALAQRTEALRGISEHFPCEAPCKLSPAQGKCGECGAYRFETWCAGCVARAALATEEDRG